MTGSNRRPPACKAGALPAELIPRKPHSVLFLQTAPMLPAGLWLVALVGLVGLEPTTPALSRRCSNQLSYRPQLPTAAHDWPFRLFVLSIPTADKCECLSPRRDLLFQKGGDPAAPSDTATLLRLHPSHEPCRGDRPPCG